MDQKKRILVVENEKVGAIILCKILDKLGYDSLAPAHSYHEAIRAIEDEKIDLVMLDIELGESKTGIDVANYIQEKFTIPFVYCSSHSDPKTLSLAKLTLPYAYLVKPYKKEDVLTAIEIAFNNHGRFIRNSKVDENSMPNFTPMEKVVLQKIADNLTTKSIAEQLFISESTVKNHRHNICQKLNLSSETHSLINWVLNNKNQLGF